MDHEGMQSLFSGNFDISRIILALQIESGVTIEASTTLIIFDEVQEVPRALTSIKYFYENAPDYHVIAAGSLLGVNFPEFLNATGNEKLAELLETQDFDLITSFKGKYIDLLKQYYYIGGMPKVVSRFIETQDYTVVREEQNQLLMAYEQDFSKHAPNEAVPRIRMLWASVPAQLAKENKKFVYGLIKQGARAREYELAMQWLLDCGLIYKVARITKPGMPLVAYQDLYAFKLFVLDVGLLSAMSRLDIKSLLEGSKVFEEFKGSLTEQYVLQQLIRNKEIIPYYWSAEKSSGEIDFVFQHGMDVVPLEVKATENLQAKSLKNYCLKYDPKYAVRTSMSDYKKEAWLANLPLYAINGTSLDL